MVLLTATIVAGVDVAVPRLLGDYLGLSPSLHQAIETVVLAVATAAVLWAVVIRTLRADADAERLVSRSREEILLRDARRQEFESALHQAVEMAGTEEAVYRATAKAIRSGAPALDAELLLADSSEAHLKRAVEVGGEARRARCEVTSPRDCPAIRHSQTLTFSSSEELGACPQLEDRSCGPCAAVCVPVSVGGRSIGVLHAASDTAVPPTPADAAALEAIATQSGARIGMLRVMEATHLQAATDPLTGLLNRRSFENRAHELVRRGTAFALAMGDLDHFKKLNDTHGHDAGDRALRVFSQTMKASLRSEDLICRYGGEEFVILFPHRSTAEAAAALKRVQEELLLAVASGTIPPFTASFGVAHTNDASDIEELIRVADSALLRAKREGRNRVILEQARLYPVEG